MDLQSYYVSYKYPITGNKIIDYDMKLEIDKQVKDFYQEVNKNSIEGIKYNLEITYDKKQYKNYVTYIVYTTFDFGGAHPNTKVQTLTYLDSNKITIRELFTPEQLKKVSKYVLTELLKHKGAVKDMAIDGTKPIYSNFENFYYTDKGIMFVFEQYQVAPYSSGIIEILVPSKIIKNIITN